MARSEQLKRHKYEGEEGCWDGYEKNQVNKRNHAKAHSMKQRAIKILMILSGRTELINSGRDTDKADALNRLTRFRIKKKEIER